MAALMIGLSIVVMLWSILLLVAVLATAAVVARMAAHLRDDSWARIAAQHGALRRREQHLMDGRAPGPVVDRDMEAS